MASALSAMLDAYRSALAATTPVFTSISENQPPEDPDGNVHRKCFLHLGDRRRVTSLHGGGVLEYVSEVFLDVWWNPEGAESTIWNTIADDEHAFTTTMLTQANRPSGTINVQGGDLLQQLEKTAVKIHRRYGFEVTTRETVAL